MSTLDVGRLRAWLEVAGTEKWERDLKQADDQLNKLGTRATKSLGETEKALAGVDKAVTSTSRKITTESKAIATIVDQSMSTVEAAQLRVKRASEAQADALAAVTRASDDANFERIAGETDAYAAANRRLDAALDAAAKSQRENITAAKELAKAQKDAAKDAEASVRETGSKLGGKFGEAFSSGTVRALIAGAPAMLSGATAIGAGVGGALVFAFGAGLAGLGIASAMALDDVELKWNLMESRIAGRAQKIARPFAQEMGQVMSIIERTWATIEDEIAGTYLRLAPATSRFVMNTGKGIAELARSFDPLSRAAEAVMDDLGGRMPRMMAGLSDALTDLADSVAENPEAFGDMIEGMVTLVEAGIDLLDFLVEAKASFDDLNPAVQRLVAPWMLLGDAYNAFNDEAPTTVDSLDNIASGAHQAGAMTEDLEKAQKDAATAAKKHAESLDELVANVFELIGGELALQGATDSAEEAFADYTEALKNNKAGSEEVTDAQRAAESAALDLAEATYTETLRQQDAAGKKRDNAAATDAAKAAYQRMADQTKGPLRDALLQNIADLDDLLARLRSLNATFTAHVSVTQTAGSQLATGNGKTFGGNKTYARGGSIKPHEIGQVVENEPELLNTGGRTYLMMSRQGGHITPMSELANRATGGAGFGGGGGGGHFTVSFERTGDRLTDALIDGMRVRIDRRFGGDARKALART